MTGTPKTVAVVLAGGIGVRVGLGIPKQLIKIAGKAIVEHTLETLDAHPLIDEVIIMMNAGSLSELDHLRGGRFPKLTRVLPGGDTRNDTTQLAIAALEGDDTKVLFHDAVRPFIDDRIIRDCIGALDEYDAVDTAIPSADTIIQVDGSRRITGIPDRSALRRGQTPQAFRLGTIRRAYEIASGDPEFRATDDCGVVFQYLPDTPIFVVDGTPENMKVTEPIDVHIADKIFQLQSASLALDTRVDHLPDLGDRTIVIFGGSYGIGASIAQLAADSGAHVFEFSRSTTGTDVRRAEDVHAAFDTVLAATGRIDVVVVTAGVLRISPLIDAPEEDLSDTIETNLLAPVMIAREAFPHLRATGGQVVLFTSSSYTRGRAGYGVYSATKAGVVNLTQALSEEWASHGVRINCINPQRTHTPMRTAAFGEEPAGTLLEPTDVARVTLNVVASELTGQIVTVQVAAMRVDAEATPTQAN